MPSCPASGRRRARIAGARGEDPELRVAREEREQPDKPGEPEGQGRQGGEGRVLVRKRLPARSDAAGGIAGGDGHGEAGRGAFERVRLVPVLGRGYRRGGAANS